ncbi:2',3'-cyclic-nucleotide 2'-phosphodiesterase/5'-or 3'-nucleotidase, 5'-nucleotidase family [Pseudobutyrivibrio sp. 49]|uniref:bifunctional metallophosphatase/5'-nucleotidase n=1 Tax=unclassified Pseudobutyrivibrio TaxID=2638619 RepID=UPI00088B2D82|nr:MULTISPECIES: 5'-nucleotidase C-terminal domain-containing protein [unclassified Pseudobutyrivibrio]SDH79880.1 2',3'-cyclic-nucleotide 2'-phosphodiesterase/5'-or 3'-nucleotidase, 5'-nucleotidase family [Pseudobutyrivibrio sp. 49]SFO02115.1 2',3'-cyclic-nucleotide 2'-phosphodiesterase/5'-or 3'-nucleotidase, 5'-nucleotidase family [Pseudobutyrivibrio sp. UC1225]
MKKRNGLKRVVTFVLAAAMVVTMGFTPTKAYAYEAEYKIVPQIAKDLSGKTLIIHSNDVHGAMDKYSQLAALRNELKARGADVILTDAGDFSQGTPYVSTTKGMYAINMMNAMGYDVVTLGNHEFDYGYAQLKYNLSNAKFKVVCADVVDAKGKNLFDANTVFTTPSGLKIGFFGLETPETQTKVNPATIKGVKFLSKSDIYTCAQSQVEALKAQGVDLVVCLSHLGVDEESAPDGHRSVDMLANTTGIDLVIDGHSHTLMSLKDADPNEPGDEPVQSTGTKLETAGIVVIDNASKKIEDMYLVKLDDGIIQDTFIAAVDKTIEDAVDAEYGVELAKSEIDLNGKKAPGVRTEETNLGDLIADGLKWSVTKEKGALTVPDDHVVAITNGGGIRASINAGSVTKKDINTVLPFGNTVAVVYVKGSVLLEALEASTYCTPEAVGGFPQVSGIKFTVNTAVPFAQGEAYPESTYYKPASINRVTIDSINGKPFKADDTYAVVTNNFVAAGGDTYYAFGSATNQFDTGIVMDEAVMDYVNTQLGGKITAKDYGTVKGNITLK